MPHILAVDSPPLLNALLEKKFTVRSVFDLIALSDPEEIKALLDQSDHDCFLCLFNLDSLRDDQLAVLDSVSRRLPVVVMTETFSDQIRQLLSDQKIVDYVLNQTSKDIDYIVELVERLYANRDFPVLIVDDSRIARTLVGEILQSYMFPVVEAKNGREAVEILKDRPDIRLIITDYVMPRMDGFELLRWIRTKLGKPRTELAVIGLSGKAASEFSAQFIKNGGNDFITKPFLKEEFVCRVVHNVEYLEHVRIIKAMATIDFLTGLYNRRHFLETAEKIYQTAMRQNIVLSLAMLDVDHFKKINDAYGHAAGDEVLRRLAGLLKTSFRKSDLTARFGGEEFIVLGVDMKIDRAGEVFDNFRQSFQDTVVEYEGRRISAAISIGVTSDKGSTLEGMISRADDLLYQAKKQGRNRVVRG